MNGDMSNRPPRRHHWVVRLTHWAAAVLIFGMIASGLQIIWQSPVIGFGPGQGGGKLGYPNSAGTLTIDSYYLSILLDHGFVGFFVYYGLIILGIVQSARVALTRDNGPDDALPGDSCEITEHL